MDDVLLPLALAIATTLLLYGAMTAVLALARGRRLRGPESRSQSSRA